MRIRTVLLLLVVWNLNLPAQAGRLLVGPGHAYAHMFASPYTPAPAISFAPLPAAEGRPVAKLPFELADGAIILKIRLNGEGRILRFLFDTGADGMAINGSLADSLGLKVARSQQTSVVGGSMSIDISENNTVHFEDGLILPGQNIGIFRNNGLNVDGIIGISLARRYTIRVDFDHALILLYEQDGYVYPKDGGVSMPLILTGSIPEIHLHLRAGEKEAEGDFVFDTGANYYIIGFGPFVKANRLLVSGFDPYASGSTISMGQSSASFTGDLAWVKLDTFRLEHVPGTLQAFREGDEKWAGMGAGSLGIKLISRWNFVLDLQNKLLWLEPNKRSE